ncbi:dipeptidyl carboxypeptidase II [Arenimonas maotaiensis]|uniref:Dipeptidyl carboxypeptidase II n=1 Tax=Arenimonas maotaiensis TaxID=1446479 RepID=A0A917CGN2_9GAMM|nr:M3 family metallopeptidase [Arenimonas maotaiensis]GGF88166.1 dipeptidyl carboxypeptidase II [Arenimonas maotaiensis]
MLKNPVTLSIALALATASLGAGAAPAEPAANHASQTMNPFFQQSPLPYQYPQFDKVKDTDFAPAFDRGMAEQAREIQAIADSRKAPTFDNTILAMERSGQLLTRAAIAFGNLTSTNTNDALDKLDAEYSPKFAAHRDSIYLNAKLFARIKALYEKRASLGLDDQGVRLIERYYTDFVRAGANLTDAQKTRVKEINAEMATLTTQFSQNVLAEVNDSAVIVSDRAELAGLSDEQIAVLAKSAEEKGMPGKYRIALLNTTGQPLLPQLDNRALRERLHKASVARGSRGNAFDNRAIVARVAKLRAERAAIMGYSSYAAFGLAEETAKNPEAVNAMLAKLAPAAVANARKEGAVLQAMIDQEQKAKKQPTFALEPWDWAYYTEKVRKAQYDFDENQLKPYLELNNVLEKGIFHAVTELYGVTFKQRTDLPVYHEDVKVYEAFNADGSELALIIVDPFARSSKRGGAWMSSYVDQSELMGTKPVVAFHLNVTEPTEGKPALLTWDDVNTAFHEFGHVLHGMFSDVKYPYFSGTNVPRDFVEFPSQVNEMWSTWPSVLANYAVHWQTGEPMPKELLDKVLSAEKFNQGYTTTEYLGAALLDQRWHQVSADQLPDADGVMAYEAKALQDVGLDYAAVPPRYRTNYFSHIMGGYAAGYYAYIWSEVLDATTVEWIKNHGGLTRANGDRFRAKLLSRGGSKDALQLFRDFAEQEPDIQPLLERRGLTAEPETK